MHIMVRTKETGEEQWIKLEEAAELMQLDPAEIEWTLEELGECENDTHLATQPE